MILWIGEQYEVVKHGGQSRVKALADFARSRGGDSYYVTWGSPIKRIPLIWRAVLRSKARYVMLTHPDSFVLGLLLPELPHLNESQMRRRRLVGYWSAQINIRLIRLCCQLTGKQLIVDAADTISNDKPGWTGQVAREEKRKYERTVFQLAHHILAVSEGEQLDIQRLCNISADRFVPAPNGAFLCRTTERREDSKTVFVLGGTLSFNTEDIADFVKEFRTYALPTAELILCGMGGEWLEPLLSDNVKYLGALSDDEFSVLLSKSDVGLILYFSDVHYFNISHPVKLSSYVAAGLPILTGDATNIAQFVNKHDIGLVATKETIGSIVRDISQNPAMVERFKKNIEAIQDDYLWSNILERAFAEIESKNISFS